MRNGRRRSRALRKLKHLKWQLFYTRNLKRKISKIPLPHHFQQMEAIRFQHEEIGIAASIKFFAGPMAV